MDYFAATPFIAEGKGDVRLRALSIIAEKCPNELADQDGSELQEQIRTVAIRLLNPQAYVYRLLAAVDRKLGESDKARECMSAAGRS
jgi:hypothetical protein